VQQNLYPTTGLTLLVTYPGDKFYYSGKAHYLNIFDTETTWYVLEGTAENLDQVAGAEDELRIRCLIYVSQERCCLAQASV